MDKNKIVILLGLLSFIVMADTWVVSSLLPAISDTFAIRVEKAGLLITAYLIPFGLFQIVSGPLADRFGKKQIILFFTVSTGLCSIAGSFTGLVVYRALTGVLAAAIMPTSLAFIGDIFPMEERQMAIGTFMGISFLGQSMSMITGGAITHFLNWRWVFGVYAVLSLVPMLLLKNYKYLPETKDTHSRFVAPYIRLLSHTKSLYTYILFILEGMFILGSFSYLGAYIAKTYHFNQLIIGAIMSAFGLMSLFGGRLGGKLVSKTGPRPILTAGLFFAHSTLLTRATQFADKARGAAMSLVAFCMMGGGG